MKSSSPITKLEQTLWNACVYQRPAKDEETVKRWQVDEFAHISERFFVQPIPSELNELVQSALGQWQQIEKRVCSGLGVNREVFLIEFEKVREDFLNRGNKWQVTTASMRNQVYGAVRNMDWVNLFAWVLPNVDRERNEEYRAIGRMVTAIFYIELLSKYGHDYESNNLKKIEARWRLVNQL